MALEPGEQIPDGSTVNGVEAETLGEVVRVFDDPESHRPAWAWISVSHSHGLIRAVPLAHATRTTSGHLVVPFSKALVAAAPDIGSATADGQPPDRIDTADEARLTRYYGRRDEGGVRSPVARSTRPAGSGLGRRATREPQSQMNRSSSGSGDDSDRNRDRRGDGDGSGGDPLARRVLTVLLAVAVVIGVARGVATAGRR